MQANFYEFEGHCFIFHYQILYCFIENRVILSLRLLISISCDGKGLNFLKGNELELHKETS